MVKSSKDKIAAIIVTYNRKQLLLECLNSLLKQTYPLDALWIIDNCSTDGTSEYLVEQGIINPALPCENGTAESVKIITADKNLNTNIDIHYVKLPENTGGAGGFYEGLDRGHKNGFDWLWLMDDDLIVCEDALKCLVDKKNELELSGENMFVLNSLVLSKDKKDDNTFAFPMQQLTKKGYPKIGVYYKNLNQIRHLTKDGLYLWACPFNGTFIPRGLIDEIGLPSRELFIIGDESDYFWRIIKKFKIYTVIDSRVYHPQWNDKGFGWKDYYAIRNMFVVNKHLNFRLLRNSKLILKSLGRGCKHGIKGLTLVFFALKDGILHKFGKKEGIDKWLNT